MLDISVRFIKIPQQFILAYTYPELEHPTSEFSKTKIKFYIDPVNGMMYSQKDIENYFHKIGLPSEKIEFEPYSNVQLIQLLLQEVSKCFENSPQQFKRNELLLLAQILSE